MRNNINFGKGRIVFERARGYLQSLQFIMNLAITVKLFDIGLIWIAVGFVALSFAVFFFMRFDIKKNMPAEYKWSWEMNPAWQEKRRDDKILAEKVDLLLKKLESK